MRLAMVFDEKSILSLGLRTDQIFRYDICMDTK